MTGERVSLRQVYGETLAELGAERDDFVTLDADMCGATFVEIFRQRFPDRHIRFGIAEQNMMSAAAGLSTTGVIPIVNTMAVFASMRALEQLRTSVAMSGFNVKIVASHQGLDVGKDGPTHQAIEDLAIVRSIPNLTVLAPADDVELRAMLRWMLDQPGPVYLRTGRSPVPRVHPERFELDPGDWPTVRHGTDVTLVGLTTQVETALKAAELLEEQGVSAQVLNASAIKPVDEARIAARIAATGAAVTVEDHTVRGGIGTLTCEILGRHAPVPVEMVGIEDRFAESATPPELFDKYGLTSEAVRDRALAAIARSRGSA